jgi:hypothetical protein
MARLTAEEVADAMNAEGIAATHGDVWKVAHLRCEYIVRDNLVPHWQDEPTEEGEYHVRGIDRVCWVYREDTEGQPWAVELLSTDAGTLATEIRWEPLNGRQVCPISQRPKE